MCVNSWANKMSIPKLTDYLSDLKQDIDDLDCSFESLGHQVPRLVRIIEAYQQREEILVEALEDLMDDAGYLGPNVPSHWCPNPPCNSTCRVWKQANETLEALKAPIKGYDAET